jgi:hypothetical protein
VFLRTVAIFGYMGVCLGQRKKGWVILGEMKDKNEKEEEEEEEM